MTAQLPRAIMLATDLTPACDRAFDRAVQLAEEWNAELVVCHVIESSAVRRPGAWSGACVMPGLNSTVSSAHHG